ncbi:hypothetical protein ARMGADRAFT_1074459 [Armillaria gallica]|uniref:Uncharacterized protein n=1 Tax=Armillaria gallica TaxID=47427 RepID=A0A2H3EH80_ARMGA|nr:hypothetical protein ARMGADRAFT_1074459 [Armillaria gallica]
MHTHQRPRRHSGSTGADINKYFLNAISYASQPSPTSPGLRDDFAAPGLDASTMETHSHTPSSSSKPVDVSNDLMISAKGHPIFRSNLATFDHFWFLSYPTVMFSTGPTFLSIQYAIWTSSHVAALSDLIRILPKSLYGKYAKDGEAPHSVFSHFYGHADDAAYRSLG